MSCLALCQKIAQFAFIMAEKQKTNKCKFKEIIEILESYEEGAEPRTNAMDLGE